jgi:hypothetical protein
MQHHRFGNLIPDLQHRIQTAHRFLEHHRDVRTAQPAHFLLRFLYKVTLAAGTIDEADPAGGDAAAGVVDEARDRQRGRRLAEPRLADDSEFSPDATARSSPCTTSTAP